MKRCKVTGRFLPKQPRTVASDVAEHNRTLRHRRLAAQFDWVTDRLMWASLGIAIGIVTSILAEIL